MKRRSWAESRPQVLTAMKTTKSLLILASLSVLAIALPGCRGGGGGALAKVNSDSISMEDFNNYLETKATVRVVVGGQTAELPVADTLAFQAMQDLVAHKLLLQLAKKEGVAPTPAEVEEEIKFKTKLQATYIQSLKSRGLSTKQIRGLVEIQLAQEKVATKGVTVTDADVQDAIKKNPNLFIEPEKATLELLYVSSQAEKDKADRDLRSGQDFTRVRAQYDKAPAALRSQFDSARYSGEGLALASLNGPFKDAVTKTQAGKLTDWLKAGGGWAKIKVHQKFAKKNLEKTPERMTFLKRQIAIQKSAGTRSVSTEISKLLKDAKIEITEASLKEPWKRFEERLKSAESTTKVQAN